MLPRFATLFAVLATAATAQSSAEAPVRSPVVIPVAADPSIGEHQSGRIIVFAKKLVDPAKPDKALEFDPFAPLEVSIAGREVTDLAAGKPALIDGEADVYPAPLSALTPGTYEIQAVLDRNHDYDYRGRGAGDLVSKVVTVALPGPVPTITLDKEVAKVTPAVVGVPGKDRATALEWQPRLKPVEFRSTRLTAFRGTPTFIRGWVALPPGYDGGKARFPTVYTEGGFYSTLESARAKAALVMADMAAGKLPPMIWVFLDQESGAGTHEFADSANNGPWGTTFATELIPALERQYRMDGKASGRFLTGHSSGGWSALWLQVRYPRLFGGSWPTSPDPSDFHAFLGADIYAPDANLFRDSAGKPFPLARDKDKVIATVEQFTRAEWAMGQYGGQMSSFEWVFSPRATDGRPTPLIDRATGRVDPAVAAYWRDNYDIANIIARDWPALRRDLDGKIHLTVGADDTFYLDRPAHRLEEAMNAVGAKTDFRYLPGKTHFDLYERAGDQMALLKDIAWEMYAIARPGSKRPAS
jgi:S-formylglutathione hydrolase FrmB